MEQSTGSPAWDKFFRDLRQGAENSRHQQKRPSKPTIAELLREKIEAAVGESVSMPRRVRAGRHQRAEGAWSWSCFRINSKVDIGSQYPMLRCLKADDDELDNLIDW